MPRASRPERVSGHPAPGHHWSIHVLFWIIAVAVVIIPLAVDPRGADPYRYPKELMFRAAALLTGAALLTVVIHSGGLRGGRPSRPAVIALTAAVAWFALVTLASTNRPLSFVAAGYAATCALFFCGAYVAARKEWTLRLFTLAIVPAVINALLAVSQATGLWRPLNHDPRFSGRFLVLGLFGNANDLASFLVISLVPATAIALAFRSRLAMGAVALLLAGVVATQGLTAMIALIPAMGVLAYLRFHQRAILASAIASAALLAIVLTVPPLRARVTRIAEQAVGARYDEVTSYRLVPFLAAWEMFTDHPIVGAGPGTFKWHYLPFRIRVELENPERYLANLQNYGEAHSDHLQLLAETGLPGYLIFLTALALLSRPSFSRRSDHPREELARLLALPLCVALFMLALTSFPLQLAGIMSSFFVFSGGALRAR